MSAPFGIQLFSDLSGFEILNDYGQAKYQITAPSPHPLFENYIVQATPSQGIVWVKGNAAAKIIDAFGNAVRAEVDRIASQLSGKYGKGRKSDFLLTGSIWDEPQYWMNALEDQTRIYAYIWDRSTGANLPDDLESVYVGAAAYGGGQGGATIEYSSTRISTAEAEIESGMSDFL
jgi:hypothetical protein